ncbi:type VI secretion protein IcmF/TssM N-terminal domain-containing protein [Rosistilla oblonga]|uniref:type VI secretion protein IcmF/TssM N-terminal domain-containing protein n=1 Tax=Rosistilla oblonga TaxID=2527990 RepID=UPI003A9810F4
MIALLKNLLSQIARIAVCAFAPIVALRHANDRWQRWGVIAIHVVAALVGIAALGYVQYALQLDTLVRSSLPMVRLTWLPLVACLLYAIAWSAWFVAHTLRMPAEKPLGGGIHSAWQDSLHRFTAAGIDVSRTPLYLVLGSPAGGVRDFFSASHTDLVVLPSAEEADQPIQVCGNRDAIYVCCREASLTGNFTRRAAASRQKLLETMGSDGAPSIPREPAHVWQSSDAATATSQSPTFAASAYGAAEPSFVAASQTGTQAATATLSRPASADGMPVDRMNEAFDHIETLTADDTDRSAKPVTILQPRTAKLPMMRLEQSEALELLERLDGLCREIAEVRQPFCPINGVVLMLPLDAADCIETADHVGMRIERDLNTIAAATQSSVSAQVIFCDLELCDGGQALLDRFPETQRHRRLGAILPAPPASEPDAGPASVDRAVRWICDELFPPLAYRLMARNLQDAAQDRILRQGNHAIHRVVDTMRQRRDGMSRLLRRSIAATAGNVRLRGCFVAATGAAGATKHAFAEGVMPQILDIQNEVQWLPQRRQRDRWQRRAAAAIYASVAITTCAVLTYLLGWHAAN